MPACALWTLCIFMSAGQGLLLQLIVGVGWLRFVPSWSAGGTCDVVLSLVLAWSWFLGAGGRVLNFWDKPAEDVLLHLSVFPLEISALGGNVPHPLYLSGIIVIRI